MVAIVVTQYYSIKGVIREKYQSQQRLVEENILQTVNYINNAYQIAEKQLDQEMKEYSYSMIEKYQISPDVDNWNLTELKNKFTGYDIYLINNNLKVIRTTYQKDLGLDFSKFGSFSTVLRRRLAGSSFSVDRIDLSTQTGEIKKYSYIPTPDHKYLFELSININDKYPSLKELDMFKDATLLTEQYKIVKEISFYSVEPLKHNAAKLRSSIKPYLKPDLPEIEERLAGQTVVKNSVQSQVVNRDGKKYTYKFFPALVSENRSEEGWNSYVVGIVYDNQVMQEELNKHRCLFIIDFLLMLIFFSAFIAVISYLLHKFEYQAHHDKLTGLANRKLLEEEFISLKNKADKTNGKLVVAFLDIDKFKEINDTFGHAVGDTVLKTVAARMKYSLKAKDSLARLGGDEFVIVLSELESQTDILNILQRLLNNLKEPILINETKFEITFSVGVSIYPIGGEKFNDLIIKSDLAMYRAKQSQQDFEFADWI